MAIANSEHYTILFSRPAEQYFGEKKTYVEISTSADEFDYLPTEGIADGSLAFFSDNWTVSAFNVKAGAWGEPQQMFG